MAPQLTPTQKARIWQYHADGLSNRKIAEKLGRDRRTVDRTIHLMEAHPDPDYYTPRSGRPRALNPADVAYAKLSLKRGHSRSSAEIQRQLFPSTGASTVRRALAMAGHHTPVHRKTLSLTKQHISARRKWAAEFRTWNFLKWKSVWFSGKSKFSLVKLNGEVHCIRGS